MFAAFFTQTAESEQPVVCGRKDCKVKTFPPGTKLEYMDSAEQGRPGRFVCNDCHQYYRNKTTTIRTGLLSQMYCVLYVMLMVFLAAEGTAAVHTESGSKAVIQNQIAEAYRGRTSFSPGYGLHRDLMRSQVHRMQFELLGVLAN